MRLDRLAPAEPLENARCGTAGAIQEAMWLAELASIV